MDKELEISITNFMAEALEFFPRGWGDLPISKAYDDLCNALNQAREKAREEEEKQETFNIF